ncbi:MAG: hypothetical protein JF584_11260 [Acidobacteria bacterium]|nr:hypothetical protein [Acidobacteriota bacterium]
MSSSRWVGGEALKAGVPGELVRSGGDAFYISSGQRPQVSSHIENQRAEGALSLRSESEFVDTPEATFTLDD